MGETQLFIVRVRRQFSRFRADARGIDEEQPRLFSEPARLCEFLRSAGTGCPETDNAPATAAVAATATTGKAGAEAAVDRDGGAQTPRRSP